MRNAKAFVLFAILFFSTPAQAGQCPNPEVKKGNPYQFVQAIILSLSEVDSAMYPSQPASPSNTVSEAADGIYRLKGNIKSYSCAASILEGYTTSNDKDIQENATKVRDTYLVSVAKLHLPTHGCASLCQKGRK